MLGLRFCVRASSSCGQWGPLFIAVHGPLTIATSRVAEHRLQTRRLSSCGSQAQLFRGMCDLPRPGLEPVSPALAGRFSTTGPPATPTCGLLNCSMRTLSCAMQVGSISLTTEQTRGPCIGSVESYPLDHQGIPPYCLDDCSFVV